MLIAPEYGLIYNSVISVRQIVFSVLSGRGAFGASRGTSGSFGDRKKGGRLILLASSIFEELGDRQVNQLGAQGP
jgi:hypothetical protein